MFNPFLSGMKSISFCTKKPVHITFVSVEGACTGCSELYHVCQLSRKCPNYPAEFPGSPVNTRASGRREYPAVADKQYFYHLFITSCIFSKLLKSSVYAGLSDSTSPAVSAYLLISSYIFSVKCPKIRPNFQKLGHRDIFLFSMAEFSFLLPSSCG